MRERVNQGRAIVSDLLLDPALDAGACFGGGTADPLVERRKRMVWSNAPLRPMQLAPAW